MTQEQVTVSNKNNPPSAQAQGIRGVREQELTYVVSTLRKCQNLQGEELRDALFDLRMWAGNRLTATVPDEPRCTCSTVESSGDPAVLRHTLDTTKGMAGFRLPGCPACEFLHERRLHE